MLITHPACILRMRRIRYGTLRPWPAVKEIAANSRLLQTTKIGVGMFSRPKIVRPIRDGRDTGIKRLKRTPEGTGINIVRLVSRGYAVKHCGIVTRASHLRRESADGPLPDMAVRINKSWDDKTPFAF